MEKHVYFVRHGKSETNTDGIYRGRGAELTDEGRAQAQAVAERIARVGVDAVVASTYARAIETATIIGDHVGLSVTEEMSLREWEHPTVVLHRHKEDPEVREILGKWFAAPEDPHARHSDEETFAMLQSRARDALGFLETHPASRLCVVTHGAFLVVLLGAMVFGEQFTKAEFIHLFKHLFMGNTGITYAHYTPEKGWRIVSWNDMAHLG